MIKPREQIEDENNTIEQLQSTIQQQAEQIAELHRQGNALLLEAAKDRQEIERLKNLLEDVVNELDLSDSAIAEHGPNGTAPAELVKLLLAEKDKTIRMLECGMCKAAHSQKGDSDDNN